MLASLYGHEAVCELLITRGCNVDMQNNSGATALIEASYYGHMEVCELLITRGCNVDMQDKDGRTALMWASYLGQIPVMISLIEAGCDYSLRNKEGKSAMDILRWNRPGKVKQVQVSRSPTQSSLTHSSRTEMNLNFEQAIFCHYLIHSVITTLASLTNQCLLTGGYRCDEREKREREG